MAESLHEAINEFGFQMAVLERLDRIIKLLEDIAQVQTITIPEFEVGDEIWQHTD